MNNEMRNTKQVEKNKSLRIQKEAFITTSRILQ